MSTWRCTAPSPRPAASARFPGLAAGGISAFKLSTYEYDAVRFPRIDHPTMLAAFREIAKTGLPVAIHNEDQELVEMLTAQARAAGRTEPIMHCRTRPPLAETMADLEIFEMALETGAHVHIAHSSLARGFEIAETFRGMGATTTGEACIQYLCMTEDDIVRLGGKGKCNPPFRTAAEVERMWECLTAGKIAYVSTDHAPWPIERKTLPDIFANGAGLTGLQSFAPLMFSLLDERGLSPTLMATYCAERSARMHGLWPKKGAIRVGSDADLCVLERGDFVFDEAAIQDRPEMRWSPYHGRRMRARVAATYLRGALIWDGASGAGAAGQRAVRPAADALTMGTRDERCTVSPAQAAAAAAYTGSRRVHRGGVRDRRRDLAAHPRRAAGLRRPRDARSGAPQPDRALQAAGERHDREHPDPRRRLCRVPLRLRGRSARHRSARSAAGHAGSRLGHLCQPIDGRRPAS